MVSIAREIPSLLFAPAASAGGRSWAPWAASAGLHLAALALALAPGLSPRTVDTAAGAPPLLLIDASPSHAAAPMPRRARRTAPPALSSVAAETPRAASDAAPSDAAPGEADASAATAGMAGAGGQGSAQETYFSRLVREIARHRRYPRVALLQGLEGTVLLEFSLGADGRVERVELRRSSRHEVLDQAALRLLRDLARVPAPPAELAPPLRLTVPVVYDLREPGTG